LFRFFPPPRVNKEIRVKLVRSPDAPAPPGVWVLAPPISCTPSLQSKTFLPFFLSQIGELKFGRGSWFYLSRVSFKQQSYWCVFTKLYLNVVLRRLVALIKL